MATFSVVLAPVIKEKISKVMDKKSIADNIRQMGIDFLNLSIKSKTAKFFQAAIRNLIALGLCAGSKPMKFATQLKSNGKDVNVKRLC